MFVFLFFSVLKCYEKFHFFKVSTVGTKIMFYEHIICHIPTEKTIESSQFCLRIQSENCNILLEKSINEATILPKIIFLYEN